MTPYRLRIERDGLRCLFSSHLLEYQGAAGQPKGKRCLWLRGLGQAGSSRCNAANASAHSTNPLLS